MTGVTLRLESPDLAAAARRLSALDLLRSGSLLDAIGAILESGARRRIGDEKSGPDGAAWAPWSDRYARTRRRAQSLLQSRGDLLDSIAFDTRAGGVAVGSNLVYAAIHQFGGAEVGKPGLPARPYLGVSAGDEADIVDAIDAFVSRRLR